MGIFRMVFDVELDDLVGEDPPAIPATEHAMAVAQEIVAANDRMRLVSCDQIG
jgi:hypothetical protein